jgi:hypothetical protein
MAIPLQARSIVTALAVAAFFAIIPSPAAAQWLNYPTPGVPKTAAGSPDLDAPAPKTADGKPNLSGTWVSVIDRPCPKAGCDDMQIGEQFLDIGFGVKGGLPLQPWAAEARKQRTADKGKDDPTSHCLPATPIQMHTSPFLRKVIQVPGLLVILNENNAAYRQIFTDGRPLPSDPSPSWSGYSSGKWDGDTLVVVTKGFRDGMWLDRNGTPMTDAATLTERFRRPSYGKLQVEVTVDDPKAYTAPWTVKLNQLIALDTDLLDSICLENEKDLPHLVGK